MASLSPMSPRSPGASGTINAAFSGGVSSSVEQGGASSSAGGNGAAGPSTMPSSMRGLQMALEQMKDDAPGSSQPGLQEVATPQIRTPEPKSRPTTQKHQTQTSHPQPQPPSLQTLTPDCKLQSAKRSRTAGDVREPASAAAVAALRPIALRPPPRVRPRALRPERVGQRPEGSVRFRNVN